MDEWKDILDAVGEHLADLSATGTHELSLPPPNRGKAVAAAGAPGESPAVPSVQSPQPQTPAPAAVPRVVAPAPEPAVEAAPDPQPSRPAPAMVPASPATVVTPTAGGASVGSDDSLESIAAALEGCRRCRLHEQRTHIVVGEGNPRARLMFIGEGPGEEEDRTGRPFVGAAGELLTKIIGAMGFERSDVYIANIVKCRPPDNRAPMTDEVETCYPFLRRQISAVQPEVIVTLGAPSSQSLLGVTVPISKLRGTFYRYGDIRVMPTYHPAYLLRNPAEKRAVWDDMKVVMAELNLSAQQET